MTGFTTSVLLYRNRVSLKEAFEGLELCEGKLSRTVLRGLDGSNPVRLLGHSGVVDTFQTDLSGPHATTDRRRNTICRAQVFRLLPYDLGPTSEISAGRR